MSIPKHGLKPDRRKQLEKLAGKWNAGLYELTISGAAKKLGLHRETLKNSMRCAAAHGIEFKPCTHPLNEAYRYNTVPRVIESEVIVDQPPPDLSIEELLDHRERVSQAKIAKDKWANLIQIKVKHHGPICVAMIGDPHIDDDGCDIKGLRRDMDIINRTEGMFAGHLGDLTNNWMGRLAIKWREQSTTHDDAKRLAEWLLKSAPNLFVIGGNHDLWDNGMDIISFICRQSKSVTQVHGARMALQFPTGREVRIHARHDFPGNSQFNPTRGERKETLWGFRDHLLVSGHRHIDGASVVPSIEGICHWMLRVSGYKVVDDYSKQNRFIPMRMASSCAVIIDPYAKIEAELCKPFWDLEEAADFLTFKRKRAA